MMIHNMIYNSVMNICFAFAGIYSMCAGVAGAFTILHSGYCAPLGCLGSVSKALAETAEHPGAAKTVLTSRLGSKHK